MIPATILSVASSSAERRSARTAPAVSPYGTACKSIPQSARGKPRRSESPSRTAQRRTTPGGYDPDRSRSEAPMGPRHLLDSRHPHGLLRRSGRLAAPEGFRHAQEPERLAVIGLDDLSA